MKYFGEWSHDTKLPHGKGIQIRQDGSIRLANYSNGEMSEGRFVTIYKSGWISVGETTKDQDGKLRWKGFQYRNDGSCEEFSL